MLGYKSFLNETLQLEPYMIAPKQRVSTAKLTVLSATRDSVNYRTRIEIGNCTCFTLAMLRYISSLWLYRHTPQVSGHNSIGHFRLLARLEALDR
jgi:hypothetical protein